MKTQRKRALVLSRETLKNLSTNVLTRVRGALETDACSDGMTSCEINRTYQTCDSTGYPSMNTCDTSRACASIDTCV